MSYIDQFLSFKNSRGEILYKGSIIENDLKILFFATKSSLYNSTIDILNQDDPKYMY
jgi:hypothetical protein